LFLRKIRSELSEGGMCVIGIENRLGLKYVMGAPDDHIGVPNIAVFDAGLARTKCLEKLGRPLRTYTYTAAEYKSILYGVGFHVVRFFAAFPDYKLPEVILPMDQLIIVDDFFLRDNYIPE